VRGLVARLRQRGHKAVVLTYVEHPSDRWEDFGFRVLEFEESPLWELHFSLDAAPHPAEAEYNNQMLAGFVARAAREIKPDVIHVAHAMKLSGAILPRLKQDGHRVICTLSDYWPLCLRTTLMKADGTMCETGPDTAWRCLACAQATHGFAKPAAEVQDEQALWRRAAAAMEGTEEPDTDFRRDVIALAARKDTLRGMLLHADRIIALSQFQRRTMIRHGVPAARIECVSHGVETAPLAEAARKRRAHPPSPPGKVVFIGPLAFHKGPHVLLEALHLAGDLPLTLELVGGDGSDAAYARRLRDFAQDDPRIVFRGQVPPEELGAILQDASALALPALWHENDPLVVKAALHCGVPVAVSNHGSLAEMVTAETGWLLQAGDLVAWAAWLREVAGNPARMLPHDVSVPTADDFAECMLKIYFELC